MICPYCKTDNREDQDVCYHCGRDISMLRLIINKARHHYIVALEHAERGRYQEAIAELQNALDLDRHDVNSHVVLGTVYARMGLVDKALKQWKEALKINPMLSKAHDYIVRAESVKKRFPTFKAVPYIVAIFCISLLLNLGLLISLSLPKQHEELFRKAWIAYNTKNYKEALRNIDTIEQTTDDPLTAQASMVLRENIQQYFNYQIRTIQNAERESRYYDALKYAHETHRRNPTPEVSELITSMIEDLENVLYQRIANNISAYYRRDVLYDKVKNEVERFIAAFSDSPQAMQLRNELDTITRDYIDSIIERLKGIAVSEDIDTAISIAKQEIEQYTETPIANSLKRFVDSLLVSDVTGDFSLVHKFIARNEYMAALDILRGVDTKIDRISSHGFEEAAQTAPKFIDERNALFIRIMQAASDDQLPDVVLTLAKNADSFSLNQQQLSIMNKMVDAANAIRIENLAGWLTEREEDFINLTISVVDARKSLDYCNAILTNMPPEKESTLKPRVLFYSTAALISLDRLSEAQDTAELLLSQYPDNEYAKIAAVLLNYSLEIPESEIRVSEEITTGTSFVNATPSIREAESPQPHVVSTLPAISEPSVSIPEKETALSKSAIPLSDLLPTTPSVFTIF